MLLCLIFLSTAIVLGSHRASTLYFQYNFGSRPATIRQNWTWTPQMLLLLAMTQEFSSFSSHLPSASPPLSNSCLNSNQRHIHIPHSNPRLAENTFTSQLITLYSKCLVKIIVERCTPIKCTYFPDVFNILHTLVVLVFQ